MKIDLVGYHVLVRPDEPEETTKGGIYIPDTAKESFRPFRGTVVATGQFSIYKHLNGSVEIRPLSVKVGDRVLYHEYSGVNIILDLGDGEREYKYMREDEIVGIIREEP